MAARRRLLGIPAKPPTFNITQHVVFKGATVLGINGRRMFETWYQMEELLLSGKLELDEIITHEFALEQFEKAHETMISGEGIKVVMMIRAHHVPGRERGGLARRRGGTDIPHRADYRA
jgi:threonine 3-dehydrogenase